jgi:hypothetical protein
MIQNGKLHITRWQPIKENMPDDIVIHQPYGGLGDNLQFSTLPELYSKLGHNVYISTTNVCRNPEIYDLIWKLNPFITGFSDKPANAGPNRCTDGYIHRSEHYIKSIEFAHGLTNGYRIYPVIYYQPKQIPELSDCLLYDTSNISNNFNIKFICSEFKDVFDKYPDTPIKRITYKNIKVNDSEFTRSEDNTHNIKTIYDLCDAIYSCKVFLCLFSGASVLASAIKQNNPSPIVYSVGPKTANQLGFQFKNINYIK